MYLRLMKPNVAIAMGTTGNQLVPVSCCLHMPSVEPTIIYCMAISTSVSQQDVLG